jgi:hypothetical protein
MIKSNLLIKETIWINTLRSFCAGIVWTIISLFMPRDAEMPLYTVFIMPFIFPFLLWAFILLAEVLKLFKLGGVGNVLCMIVAVPGDPLVYLLHQSKPDWVPVKEYKLFTFAGYIKVYQDEIPESKKTKSSITESETCPFAGNVIADTEIMMLGLAIPAKSTVFTIDNNWNVTSKGVDFGYIDQKGQIRKGLKGDPKATLAPGAVFGQIKSGYLWIEGKNVGKVI